jgi:hypothetical protein
MQLHPGNRIRDVDKCHRAYQGRVGGRGGRDSPWCKQPEARPDMQTDGSSHRECCRRTDKARTH